MPLNRTLKFLLTYCIYTLLIFPKFALGFGSFEFKHISTDMGLSQKTVQSIFQDRKGFIWIGTQEGLNRYDGREIRIFTNIQGNSASLSSNVIRDIVEDPQGNLWIATSNGLNRYDVKNQAFHRIPVKTTLGDSVTKLYSLLSVGETLLIGTDGNGVFTLNTNSKTLETSVPSNLTLLSKSDVRTIFKDSRNRTWFGTDGNGIWLEENSKIKPVNFSHDNSKKSISHDRIRSITEDSKGQIWIGTRGGGLNRFEERTKTFHRYLHDPKNVNSLGNNRVYSILEDTQRRLWIATDGGVNILESGSESFTRIEHHTSQPNGLSHNRVLSLLESKGGLIWLGTMSGLDLWDPVASKFVHYRSIAEDRNSLSNNTIYGFAENNAGDIYVATFGGGLNQFKVDSNQWHQVPNSLSNKAANLENRIMSLMVDSQQNLWIGSFSSGVSVLSSELELINHYQSEKNDPTSLSANGITDIVQDSDGDYWIATYAAGLNRLDKTTNRFTRYRQGMGPNLLKSDSVLQILEDDEGYIWLATDGGGISRLDKNTNEIINFMHQVDQPNSLTGNSTWSIFQDSRGRFWIGTQGKGLNRWEPENRRKLENNFQRYTVADGLPSSTVNGVLEDQQGFIWISTNKGVSRLDPDTDQFKHYNLALEIHDNELNQGAMLKAKDGRLYFGGLNGISAFYPTEITSNLNKPDVILTSILSENKPLKLSQSIASLDEIEFNHKDYLITFEFAALDYSQPEKNQYQYKLEGFDPEWIDSKNLNRATYTNLPSGQYLLKVKGSNNDGLWSDESINLPVTINPAPWATWWAFTIYSIIFCSFLILLIRSQAKRIANQDLFKQQVIEQIESSTQAIESENETLKKQIKNYKINSANDIETGLPNQTFFTEQVLISLAFLQKQADQKLRLFCAIIRIDDYFAKDGIQLSRLSEEILNNDENIHLSARWSNNEIALLGFSNSKKDLKKSIDNLKLCSQLSTEADSYQSYIGYTLNPLNRIDDYPYKWDNVLLLTEHVTRLATREKNENCIGLIACHQALSANVMKTIMSDTSIQSLKEKFEIHVN